MTPPVLGIEETLRPWLSHDVDCDLAEPLTEDQKARYYAETGILPPEDESCTCGLADALLRLAQPEEPGRDQLRAALVKVVGMTEPPDFGYGEWPEEQANHLVRINEVARDALLASPSAQLEDRRDSDSKIRESLPEGYAVVDGKLYRVEVGDCSLCGGHGWTADPLPSGEPDESTAQRCRCCDETSVRLVGPVDTSEGDDQ